MRPTKKDWPEGALDICLVLMEPSVFQLVLNISEKKAVDLIVHKANYLKNFEKYCSYDRNNDWAWAIEGSPREGGVQNQGRILESKFDGLYICGGSKYGSTYTTQQLTLVKQPFDREADLSCHDLGPTSDPIPSKFGGISGAGVWQVAFAGNGVPEAIDEMFFSGVCVAGIAQKCLYARGPSSLYDIFTRFLDKIDLYPTMPS